LPCGSEQIVAGVPITGRNARGAPGAGVGVGVGAGVGVGVGVGAEGEGAGCAQPASDPASARRKTISARMRQMVPGRRRAGNPRPPAAVLRAR
jgi:hypothetical protein